MRRFLSISFITALAAVAVCSLFLGVGFVHAANATPAAAQATTRSMYVTFYGWPDNSPPGNAIAYPVKHSGAGGKGTFSDPITYATDKAELAIGTIVYVPYVQRYVIMEDDCVQCDSDWSHGHKAHIDLWVGGKGAPSSAVINCEDALTQNGNVSVIVHPASNLKVSSIPLFNSSTRACYHPGS
ncbi:MAG TPA: hypothetical protein VKR06_11090 [Ktedonosporobacter sp.]|nr:hypothetical protein [Ktedonosporobacter sp.]